MELLKNTISTIVVSLAVYMGGTAVAQNMTPTKVDAEDVINMLNFAGYNLYSFDTRSIKFDKQKDRNCKVKFKAYLYERGKEPKRIEEFTRVVGVQNYAPEKLIVGSRRVKNDSVINVYTNAYGFMSQWAELKLRPTEYEGEKYVGRALQLDKYDVMTLQFDEQKFENGGFTPLMLIYPPYKGEDGFYRFCVWEGAFDAKMDNRVFEYLDWWYVVGVEIKIKE
ncbi:MAG: hypothetical protein E7070_06400 [Bacteroidales bacterium]|jgi:hypothetical protein|nr:hypothetical protein [Bacteroidales bacterium]